MSENPKTRNSPLINLAFTALLAALVIVLQIAGGIPVGPFSITLTLVPIVVGSILLGWQYGAVLGLVFGVVVSILSLTGKDPGGNMVFQANAVVAWIMCLLKGVAAGLFPGLIYKAFTRAKYASHVFMAISGVFLLLGGFAVGKLVSFEKTWQTTVLVIVVALLAAVYMLLAYRAVKSGNTAVYLAAMAAPVANTGIFILGMALFVISGLVGINFLIEFSVAVLLSPAIATIVKVIRKKR